jgi:hypothetical protein
LLLLRVLQEFDAVSESEISIINRLSAERQDNVMWREFRTRLLRNMGLVRRCTTVNSSLAQLANHVVPAALATDKPSKLANMSRLCTVRIPRLMSRQIMAAAQSV